VLVLKLYSSAGQERFNALTMQYFRGLSGLVLVFSVTSAQSLNAARRWYEQALKHCTNGSPPTVLVGNKLDLVQNGTPREVSTNDVNNFVQRLPGLLDTNEVKYMEISAKDNDAVEKCFVTLSQAMLTHEENLAGISAGNKTVENYASNNTIANSAGNNAAENSTGNKTVENSTGNKTVANSAGNNTAENSTGNKTVENYAGNNTAGNSVDINTVENSTGNKTVENSASNKTVVVLEEQPAPRMSKCSC